MNDKIVMEELLQQVAQENRGELAEFSPDFDRIRSFVKKESARRRAKRRGTALLRVAAAVVAVLIVGNVLIFFSEYAPVRAYRAELRRLVFNLANDKDAPHNEAEIRRSADELAKVADIVPFHIPEPGWIPEGYSFDKVTATKDINDVGSVWIRYVRQDDPFIDEPLLITINNDSGLSETIPSSGEGLHDKFMVNNIEVYLSTYYTDGPTQLKADYYNEQGLHIHIASSLDKQSLLRFISELR